MLSSRNFDPDWGRFVPSPNYRAMLTAVSVATAIGATGSAAVVLSLVDRQTGVSDTQSISAPTKAPTYVAAESITLTKAEPIVEPPGRRSANSIDPQQEPSGPFGKLRDAQRERAPSRASCCAKRRNT